MLFDKPPQDVAKGLWLAQMLALFRVPDPQSSMYDKFFLDAGSSASTRYAAATATTPAYFMATNPSGTLVCINGAENPTLAGGLWSAYGGSLLDSQTDPRNAFIDAAAAIIGDVLFRYLNGLTGKIVIAGYSFGGAVAAVLGVGVAAGRSPLDTEVISFGAPRPGGNSLDIALANVQVVRWMNNDDWVPMIPPKTIENGSYGLVSTAPTIRRYNHFHQPHGGFSLGVQGTIEPSPKPLAAVMPGPLSLLSSLVADEANLWGSHGLLQYQERLGRAVPAGPLPEGGTWGGSDAEDLDTTTRREIQHQQQVMQSIIFNVGVTQNDAELVIPKQRLFTARRVGRTWFVYFGDREICAAPIKKRARGIANAGNDFIRRLQRQAVVDPEALADQFVAYLAAASDPSSGFSPTLNTVFPAMPS